MDQRERRPNPGSAARAGRRARRRRRRAARLAGRAARNRARRAARLAGHAAVPKEQAAARRGRRRGRRVARAAARGARLARRATGRAATAAAGRAATRAARHRALADGSRPNLHRGPLERKHALRRTASAGTMLGKGSTKPSRPLISARQADLGDLHWAGDNAAGASPGGNTRNAGKFAPCRRHGMPGSGATTLPGLRCSGSGGQPHHLPHAVAQAAPNAAPLSAPLTVPNAVPPVGLRAPPAAPLAAMNDGPRAVLQVAVICEVAAAERSAKSPRLKAAPQDAPHAALAAARSLQRRAP